MELKDIGEKIVQAIRDQLELEDRNATRTASVSLEYRISGVASIEILGEDYLQQINEGRQAGSFPNYNNLLQWVFFRDIKIEYEGKMLTPQQTAFVIGRAIGDEGVQTSGSIAKFGNQLGVIDRAIENIEDEIVEDLEDIYFEFLDRQLSL